jgi:hypothetical protein
MTRRGWVVAILLVEALATVGLIWSHGPWLLGVGAVLLTGPLVLPMVATTHPPTRWYAALAQAGIVLGIGMALVLPTWTWVAHGAATWQEAWGQSGPTGVVLFAGGLAALILGRGGRHA